MGSIAAQTAAAKDETAIRALYAQLRDGWSKGSARSFAGPFTEDADFIAFDGTYCKSRREIASAHQPLFETWLKGLRLVGEVQSVRFLTPEVAVMYVAGRTIMRGKSAPAPERDAIQTLVAINSGDAQSGNRRVSGLWRLRTVHWESGSLNKISLECSITM